MRRLLITGAGKAALACVEQLSKLKHQFMISVLRAPAGQRLNGEETEAEPECDETRFLQLGVEVRANVCVEAIDRYAKLVRGCDGSRTTFDTLILAAGSENPRLARAAGLEVRSGVLLNDFLQTSDAHVYALGEGAEHRGSIYTDSENIAEQARVLAAHVTGNAPGPFAPAASETPVNLLSLSDSIRTCVASPSASAGSAPRLEDQTLEPEGQPALAGAA